MTEPPRPTARELVRRRSGSYARPETGRHHHIGAAPEQQPVLGEDGPGYVRTSDVQLAGRTTAQLDAERARLGQQMARASREFDFEHAAALRDDLTRIDAELARRHTGVDSDVPAVSVTKPER